MHVGKGEGMEFNIITNKLNAIWSRVRAIKQFKTWCRKEDKNLQALPLASGSN